MRIQEAYNSWAATYDEDRNLTRDLDQMVTRQLLGKMRCRSILEIGCGTGKNTLLLTQIARHVLAVDFSLGMIGQARQRLPQDNLAFVVADLTTQWPAVDQSVDLIVCNLVLEHVRDLLFIFAEAFRCLNNGGRFFVCELHPERQYRGTKANFQRDSMTFEIDSFVHHSSDFTNAGVTTRFSLKRFNEWWHEEDSAKPPRLASFIFEKSV